MIEKQNNPYEAASFQYEEFLSHSKLPDNGSHRSKYLLTSENHVSADFSEHRRLVEELSQTAISTPPYHHFTSLGNCIRHMALNLGTSEMGRLSAKVRLFSDTIIMASSQNSIISEKILKV